MSGIALVTVRADRHPGREALFRTTAFFRRVATEVGDALGYEYPEDVDDAVTAQLRGVRGLPHKA
jgi:hypothetical protein